MIAIEATEHRVAMERLRAATDPVAFERAWAAGRAMSMAEAVALATG